MDKIEHQSGVSIPLQVRSILSEEIGRGVYKASGKLPAERGLAERFGISRTSVREGLNILVKDGVLVRLVGKGTFFARAEKGAQTKSAGHLAFLIGDQPGYARILIGAQQVCRRHNYSLLFHSAGEEEADSRLGLPGEVQGILVAGGLRPRALVKWDVPIVLTGPIVDDEHTAAVGADYASGTRRALEHLSDLGHRKIGFIGFPNSEKYRAYWETLEKLGLVYNPHFVHFLRLPDLGSGIAAGYWGARSLLSSGPRPTAILAGNDLMAMGAIEALSLAGIQTPRQMSVIGYDDSGEHMTLPLTTIRSHSDEIGRIAAQVLIDKLAGRPAQNRIAVPTELVVRSTTAPPWGAEREVKQ